MSAQSKKYAGLMPAFSMRLLHGVRNKPDPQQAARTQMHIHYGAFVDAAFHKRAAKIVARITDIPALDAVMRLMRLHASTRERLPHLQGLYDFVFSVTGPVRSVLDLGCGLNPLTTILLPTGVQAWHGYDICRAQADLLNTVLRMHDAPAAVRCMDLVTDTPTEQVCVALLMKTAPVLDAQQPGRTAALIRDIAARHVVISYPTKSLCGREKGMKTTYSAQFAAMLDSGRLGPRKLVAQGTIGGEMVFVLG